MKLLIKLVALFVAVSATVSFARAQLPPVSQNQPVTASSFEVGNIPANGNDGNLATRWAASDSTYPQWWRVDIGPIKPIYQVAINWYNSASRAYQYRIEASNDDKNYTVIVDKTANSSFGDTTDTFSVNTWRYVRITVTGCSATGGFASFYECKVYEVYFTIPTMPRIQGSNEHRQARTIDLR